MWESRPEPNVIKIVTTKNHGVITVKQGKLGVTNGKIFIPLLVACDYHEKQTAQKTMHKLGIDTIEYSEFKKFMSKHFV